METLDFRAFLPGAGGASAGSPVDRVLHGPAQAGRQHLNAYGQDVNRNLAARRRLGRLLREVRRRFVQVNPVG